MVMSINENRVLCTLQPVKATDCDEMATVRRGLDDIRHLQDYADAQAGGPGKGFFQIVTDPYEARRVINQGRMAVVLEIEVSEPFGCRGWARPPTCDRAQIDRELDDLYQRGVRSALLLNKYDNPLAGTRFDSGAAGHADQRRQPRQRGQLLEREDVHRAAARQPDRARRPRHPHRPHGADRHHAPAAAAVSEGAALQHARAHRARRAHGERADGQAHDRQPRPHEPEGGRPDARRCWSSAATRA